MTEADKIIDALRGFEGPLQALWGYAMKANYYYVCADIVWIVALVVVAVALAKFMPPLNKEEYDWFGIHLGQKVIIGFPVLVAMIIFSIALFRIIAPEMAVINDICNTILPTMGG